MIQRPTFGTLNNFVLWALARENVIEISTAMKIGLTLPAEDIAMANTWWRVDFVNYCNTEWPKEKCQTFVKEKLINILEKAKSKKEELIREYESKRAGEYKHREDIWKQIVIANRFIASEEAGLRRVKDIRGISSIVSSLDFPRIEKNGLDWIMETRWRELLAE